MKKNGQELNYNGPDCHPSQRVSEYNAIANDPKSDIF